MVNKDFLKQVFIHEKKLLKLSEVKFKHVPLYDELSVVKLWPLMQEDKEFMQFMPEVKNHLVKGLSNAVQSPDLEPDSQDNH